MASSLTVTRLVVVFNRSKLILGSAVAMVLVLIGVLVPGLPSWPFVGMAALVVLNMAMALMASYWLYDVSDLFQLKKWPGELVPNGAREGVLVHASFDPISRGLEAQFASMRLHVFNIYGNRHEKDPGVELSDRIFPPHPSQQTIDPTHMPNEAGSVDVVFGVTAIHELMSHAQRVAFFAEARRILRPGGRLILIEQMRTPINFLFFNIGAFHFLTPGSWRHCIGEGGLRVVREMQMTPFAAMWVLEV